MSFIPFRNNPAHAVVDFAAQKILTSGVKGNIAVIGATNGKNAKYLIQNYLKKWGNPSYKFYVVDDFSDEFGIERRDEFVENTKDVKEWIVHYRSNEFDHLLDKTYALVIFRSLESAVTTHGEASLLWPQLLPGGYLYFLNYFRDEYDMDLSKTPRAGVDFFMQQWKDYSSDSGMKPHPYIKKD